MARIVTTHYRYKRPPRKRKADVLEAPSVVATKSSHRPNLEKKAAAQPSTPIVTAKAAAAQLQGRRRLRWCPRLRRRAQRSQAHRARQRELLLSRLPTMTASRRRRRSPRLSPQSVRSA